MLSIIDTQHNRIDEVLITNGHIVDTLGNRIRQARLAAGLSQAEIARRCKVTRGAVSNWEKDLVSNLRNSHLYALADATGFSPRWISTGKGEQKGIPILPPDVERELAAMTPEQLDELLQYARFRFRED